MGAANIIITKNKLLVGLESKLQHQRLIHQKHFTCNLDITREFISLTHECGCEMSLGHRTRLNDLGFGNDSEIELSFWKFGLQVKHCQVYKEQAEKCIA